MEAVVPNLHSYQKELVESIIQKQRLALFVNMGLGKTLITLTAINHLLTECQVHKVLIIAPVSVYQNVWCAEIDKWSSLDKIRYKVFDFAKGGLLDPDVFDDSINTVVCRSTILEKLFSFRKGIAKFDMLVIDECTEFKSFKTKRFQALKRHLHHFERRLILTGTPVSNGYMDLWSQIYILDEGKRLGSNITAYRNRFFTSYKNRWSFYLKPESIPDIHRLINDLVISVNIDWQSAAGLVEDTSSSTKRKFHSIIEYIELSPYCMQFYNKLRRQMCLQFTSIFMTGDVNIRCKQAADLTNKLLQFSSGSIYTDDGKYLIAHSSKFVGLRKIILNHIKENILVVYNYKHEGERIKKEFPQAVQLTKDNIKDWNDNKIRLAFFQVSTLARGVNLQHGGNIIVWFGFTWSLELYQQTNARLYRQGQTKDVYCYHLCCTPIEHRLLKTLEKKDATQQHLLDALKKVVYGE